MDPAEPRPSTVTATPIDNQIQVNSTIKPEKEDDGTFGKDYSGLENPGLCVHASTVETLAVTMIVHDAIKEEPSPQSEYSSDPLQGNPNGCAEENLKYLQELCKSESSNEMVEHVAEECTDYPNVTSKNCSPIISDTVKTELCSDEMPALEPVLESEGSPQGMLTRSRTKTKEAKNPCTSAETKEKRKTKRNVTKATQEIYGKLHREKAKFRKSSCDLCHKLFPSYQLPEHKKSCVIKDGTIREHQCDLCHKYFATSKKLHRHKREVCQKGNESWCCSLCGKEFHTKFAMQKHRSNVHGPRSHKCEVCSKVFKNKYYLNQHKVLHEEVKPFICHICGKDFAQNIQLCMHVEREHGQIVPRRNGDVNSYFTSFDCAICGKTMKSKAALNYHKLIHEDIKPFNCDQCCRQFRCKSSLDGHYKTHDKDRGYNCEMCRKTWLSTVGFRTHMFNVHQISLKEKSSKLSTVSCKLCDEAFDQKNMGQHFLTMHSDQLHLYKRMDLGFRLHECNLCNKLFAKKNFLYIHKKRHEEPAFKCSHCGKSFYRKYELEVHERKHTGEKPYECGLCAKQFGDKSNLIHHRKKCPMPKLQMPKDLC